MVSRESKYTVEKCVTIKWIQPYDNNFISIFFYMKRILLRDRPFNLRGWGGGMVFCFVQNYFFRTTRVSLFICEFFSQNLTLGYLTKTLNQIIFFSSTKIFFSATLGIRIFFQKKKHNPSPPPLKLNGCSLIKY